MKQSLLPFNRPLILGKADEYIRQVLRTRQIAGGGPFTQKAESLLGEILGVPRVLLTTSCTHALEMSALLLKLKEGDEVILPSFTFVSTANAFVLYGARPVFVDIKPTTLNLDERQLEALITSRTRAIVVVHYAGIGCEMEAILKIANRHGISVVEDNAHGLFGKYQGRNLGTFGCLSAQSFHETKNLTCGEGGALVINDPQYHDRAEVLLEKGTDRRRFLRGEINQYSWIDVGSSYLPSDILAAILYAQLEVRHEIQARRRRIWEYYFQHLQDWARRQGVQLPTVPPQCEQPYSLFYLILPSPRARQALIAHLKKKNIMAAFHYLPLHLSQMGRRFKGKVGDCPVTEQVSNGLVRLPFYNDLTEKDQARVVETTLEFTL